MTQVNRLDGGLIDRNTPLGFTFDGTAYTGYAGDTLASALVANGVVERRLAELPRALGLGPDAVRVGEDAPASTKQNIQPAAVGLP